MLVLVSGLYSILASIIAMWPVCSPIPLPNMWVATAQRTNHSQIWQSPTSDGSHRHHSHRVRMHVHVSQNQMRIDHYSHLNVKLGPFVWLYFNYLFYAPIRRHKFRSIQPANRSYVCHWSSVTSISRALTFTYTETHILSHAVGKIQCPQIICTLINTYAPDDKTNNGHSHRLILPYALQTPVIIPIEAPYVMSATC